MPLLSDSICFEVASEVHRREDQLKKNKSLVEQNAGILAPVLRLNVSLVWVAVAGVRGYVLWLRLAMVRQASRCNFNKEVTGATVSDVLWRMDGRGWWCLVRWSWRARCFPISSKEP